jgi:hypothetical protein
MEEARHNTRQSECEVVGPPHFEFDVRSAPK